MTDLFDLRDDGDCLSRLELDRLVANEAVDDDVRARLDACEHCRERLADLRQERTAFLAANAPERIAALTEAVEAAGGVRRAPWWRRVFDWKLGAAASAAVAVAILLLVVLPRGEQGGVPDRVRLKGDVVFEVLVQGPGGGFERYVGPVPAGTTLGFRVGCAADCTIAIVGVGDRGPAYVVDKGQRVRAGEPVTLGFTVDLDDQGTAERLFAVACAGEPDAAAIAAAVDEAYPEAGRDLAAGVPLIVTRDAAEPLSGCATRSVRVERAPR